MIVDGIASLSFLTHFANISRGVIDFRDLVYFALLIGTFLYANTNCAAVETGGLTTMSTRSQQRLSATSLVILAIGFIVAVAISNALFSGWRIDLTEDRLYTLSDGTRSMLGKIEEPINLYFYFSDQVTRDVPSIRRYADRVREMLREFEDAADGRLRLNIIDPLPFSEDEDRATGFGLQGVSLGITPDPIYLGLAGTNSLDNEEVIPFFQPDKEAFLEYDIAKLISALANPDRTIIGVVSPLEMAGSFNPQMQGMSRPWVVYQQIEQLFEVRKPGHDIQRDRRRRQYPADRAATRSRQRCAVCDRPVCPARRQGGDLRRPARQY